MPSGLPTASTHSPISDLVRVAQPRGHQARRAASPAAPPPRRSARPCPPPWPAARCPSENTTVTLVALSTTWLLVRMLPLVSSNTPEPVPRPGPGCGSAGRPRRSRRSARRSRAGRARRARGARRAARGRARHARLFRLDVQAHHAGSQRLGHAGERPRQRRGPRAAPASWGSPPGRRRPLLRMECPQSASPHRKPGRQDNHPPPGYCPPGHECASFVFDASAMVAVSSSLLDKSESPRISRRRWSNYSDGRFLPRPGRPHRLIKLCIPKCGRAQLQLYRQSGARQNVAASARRIKTPPFISNPRSHPCSGTKQIARLRSRPRGFHLAPSWFTGVHGWPGQARP